MGDDAAGESYVRSSNSKGGRSGPLTDPMQLPLATLGGHLEAQQLPPAGGDSSGLERATKEVGVLELGCGPGEISRPRSV